MAKFDAVQVNLWCADVERCAAFFRRLGMPERFRFPPDGEPHQVEVEAAGVRIGLTSARVGDELFGIATTPGENTEVVLWCADVDSLHRAALDAGGEPLTTPTDLPDGRLRYAWLRDPEGHRVKLVQERSRA
ncbi:VOC family protein [Streptomyces sp. NPDC101171]|uniref:VOC family protein n=1 Tax=Streptomyces sp. NPDC101171 TaxID=3366122 RepID=UPI0037F457CF